ncbi:phosphatidate cytidylyltransferase [Oleiagrimonas sp. C23AA]|uniref:phosphatidate cytidylyltransferase n=1 Tax=Oleiagrimonas sp. C23AA TaxID=2719047 RepID=UPI001421336A|nr:phosphatidate cytidylyltransferase [Oleiagrimonas sp. C23AA]NII12349.1 phosphatidate cytidylyltransferase [Oleiagrimonas sp. C23AA]
MLLQRTLTALLLAPLAALVIILPPTWLFATIVGVVFAGGAWEWTRLCGLGSAIARGVYTGLVLVAFALLWFARLTPALWLALIALGVIWWVASLWWMRAYSFAASPNTENRILKLGTGLVLFIPAWVAIASIHGSPILGHWWTLLTLVIVWAADTGAYFSGRFLGRTKLAPRISPGKTWAGVYGALVAGTAIAVLGGWVLDVHGARLVGLAVLGMLTVAASIIGDLFESLMKRHAQIKDSGTLIPGHGGLLDRMDSVFAALPVFALGKLLLGL